MQMSTDGAHGTGSGYHIWGGWSSSPHDGAVKAYLFTRSVYDVVEGRCSGNTDPNADFNCAILSLERIAASGDTHGTDAATCCTPEAASCSTCSAGQYQDSSGQDACIDCPAGQYSDPHTVLSNAVSLGDGYCSDWRYLPQGLASLCTDCDPLPPPLFFTTLSQTGRFGPTSRTLHLRKFKCRRRLWRPFFKTTTCPLHQEAHFSR